MEKFENSKNYVSIIAENSFWNLINYVLTGVSGLVVSILLARSLGTGDYGVYSFLVSIVAVACVFLDFGIGQAINKYIPRYFADPKNKGLAIKIFEKSLFIQFVITVLLSVILILTQGLWCGLIKVNHLNMNVYITILLISLTPQVIARQVMNFLSATQNSKIIALINLASQILNLILVVIFAILFKNLMLIFVMQVIISLFTCFLLYKYVKPLLHYEANPTKAIKLKEIKNFTLLAYANTILTFIVWSYSEVFFLGYYSSPEEVGFYTLAFSLASIVSSLPGLYLRTTYNVQFELIEKREEILADKISSSNVKIMTILFLPLSIFITYFSKTIIGLMYGTSYEKVHIILPFVLFGTIISTTLGAPIIKANNDNKIFGNTVGISVMGAILNLALNYLLIPRYNSIGAGIANFLSQIILTIILLIYVFNAIKIKVDWLKIIKVYLINMMIAFFLFSSNFFLSNIFCKFFFFLMAMLVYLLFLIKLKVFDKIDQKLFEMIQEKLPNFLRMPIHAIIKAIDGNIKEY